MLFFWLVTQSSPTRRNACWKPKNVPWEAIRQRADVVFSCTRKYQTSSRRIGSMCWVAANVVWLWFWCNIQHLTCPSLVFTVIFHAWSRIGSLSKDDGDFNENVKKAIGLDWRNNNCARASRFLYISLPSLQDYDVKKLNFTFCGGRDHKKTNFLFFSWTSIQSFRIQLQKKLPTFNEVS